jgi:acyl-CoA dehydrogenase
MSGRSEVRELTARIIADRFTNGDERDHDWPDFTWNGLADAGLPWVGIDTDLGGSGGSLADACDVLWEIGAGAVPVPYAETSILAGWLFAVAGLGVPEGPTTLGVVPPDRPTTRDSRGRLSTVLERVPWATRATHLAVVWTEDEQDLVAVLPTEAVSVIPGRNLAGEPRDQVVLDLELSSEQVAPLPTGVDRAAISGRGALSRAVLMAGAMERVAALTVGYTNDRLQFGKPVITFQAVAALVVQLVEQAVVGATAARLAIAAGDDATLPIAVAKQQTSAAASGVARLAHQAHGAIGMTAEYELGRLTRRLWCWRHEYGTEREWARWLGSRVTDLGADALWPLITRGEHL